MPSLSQFYRVLKNYDDSKWWCPTEEFFWQDEGCDVKEEYDELKRIVATKCPQTMFTGDAHHKALTEHTTKIQLLKQRLAILTEQEKPKGTLEEEAKVRYWEQQMEQLTVRDNSEHYLLHQLEQVEAKHQRAILEYQNAKADIEKKLVCVRTKKTLEEARLATNLTNARNKLDAVKSFRSNPRIRLEMELEPHQKYLDDYTNELRAVDAWKEANDKLKVLEAKVWERKVAWFKVKAAEWNAEQDQAERERAYRATLPIPEFKPPPKTTTVSTKVKVRKTIKTVKTTEQIEIEMMMKEDSNVNLIGQAQSLGQQTQSSSSGLEGCNSGAASPDAKTELMAGDPQ